MKTLVTIFGALAIFLILIIYSAFSWGFVCWNFWYWFVIPIFTTLPLITFVQAVGLMFFINLFKNQTAQAIKKEYTDEMLERVILFVSPWLTFLCGWIVKIIIF